MNNKLIREKAKRCGVRMWQIAEAMGMQDSGLSRKLRHEIPEEETSMILVIIDELAREGTGGSIKT